MLQFDNLSILPVDDSTMHEALWQMQAHASLKPRDAIHLAAMLTAKLAVIVSDDGDFDKVPSVKRQALD